MDVKVEALGLFLVVLVYSHIGPCGVFSYNYVYIFRGGKINYQAKYVHIFRVCCL